MPKPIDGRIDASGQTIKGIKTKPLLLFLLSVTNFHHFPKKILAVLDTRRRPCRRGTNSVRAMTLRTITLAMRRHRLLDGNFNQSRASRRGLHRAIILQENPMSPNADGNKPIDPVGSFARDR